MRIMLKGTVEEIERFAAEMLIPGIELVNQEKGIPDYFKLTEDDGKYFPNSKRPDIKVRYWGGNFTVKKSE